MQTTPKPLIQHFIGLDLGQAQDPTALCVLERTRLDDAPTEYDCRDLRRWGLGTPYPQIVRHVLDLLASPELISPVLVIDSTGVGRAVSDLFREQLTCIPFWPVTITGGNSVNRAENGDWLVPKKDLVGVLQVLLGHRRIRIAKSLKEAEILVKELANFQVKVTLAANETYGAWREGTHDDLVLALAVAAWVAERQVPWECPSSTPDSNTEKFHWKRDARDESPMRRLYRGRR